MNKVYITGLGCVTPLGNNIESLWEGLIAGRCGIAPIAAPHSENLPVHVAAEVKNFNPEEYDIDKGTIRRNDMYTLFALAAAHQPPADMARALCAAARAHSTHPDDRSAAVIQLALPRLA